ncbi:MAG: PQQ-binding-like beta-propeller repeat protein [Chloroflexota bacterium]
MKKFSLSILVAFILIFPMLPWAVEAALGFGDPNFQKVWQRTDKILTERTGVGRGFIWGSDSIFAGNEPYTDVSGGQRTVQYFDKARMEVNNPKGNRNDPNFVTSGLLVKELVLGRVQNGDDPNNYAQGYPSEVQIVGDPNTDGANAVAPTYRSFKNLATFNQDNPVESKLGQQVTQRINRAGLVTLNITPPDPNVRLTTYEPATRHNIADVFVAYGNQRGLVWNGSTYVEDALFVTSSSPNATYIFGLPITDPYWVRAVVAGVEKDVLVQLFERRVLTYTPTNDANSRVEMGNVGQHYYRWRYQEDLGRKGTPPLVPSTDYSQARATYLKSGSIPQGGPGKVSEYNTGTNFSSSWPVYDPDKKLAIISAGGTLLAVDLSDFNHPTLRWKVVGPNGFTPVTLFNGVVYSGGEGGNLFAVNESDGSLYWQVTIGGLGFDSLIVPDATSLYLVRGDGLLYSRNLSDGSPRWTAHPSNGAKVVSGPVLDPDGTIYVGANDQKIYAFKPDGSQVGTEVWLPETLDSFPSKYALAIGGGRVYVGTVNGSLYALNKNGTIQSQKKLSGGQGILSVPAVVVDSSGSGRVYVGSDEGRVYGVDANNVANIEWTFSAPGGGANYARSSVAVLDGYVYFGMDDRNIYRVEAGNPTKYTVLTTAGNSFGTNPPVVNSGYLVITSRDGVLHFIR